MSDLGNLVRLSPWAQRNQEKGQLTVPSSDDLSLVAGTVRRNILLMTTNANSGHPGGSLSATEALIALYHRVMRHRPDDPSWSDRSGKWV